MNKPLTTVLDFGTIKTIRKWVYKKMTTKEAFLNGNTVTVTDGVTGSVITVSRAGHNRFYVTYNGTTRVVPFMAAYQVVSEKSAISIEQRAFIYQYTPTTV